MLNSNGFDLWAGGYDKSVGISDECGTYPFAGYKTILNTICNRILIYFRKNRPVTSHRAVPFIRLSPRQRSCAFTRSSCILSLRWLKLMGS